MGATGPLGANPPGTESLNKRRYLTATNTPRSTVHNHQLILHPYPLRLSKMLTPDSKTPTPSSPQKLLLLQYSIMPNQNQNQSLPAGWLVGGWGTARR